MKFERGAMMSLLLGFHRPVYANGVCRDLFASMVFLNIDNAARVGVQSLLMATNRVADAYFDDKCHRALPKDRKTRYDNPAETH